MHPFQGRLLVGVGHLLRIYDIGKKKMLRKCENKHLPHMVVDIQTMGSRIFVSDVQEAVHFIKYKAADNQLVIFADEVYQRSVWEREGGQRVPLLDYSVFEHCLY